MWCSLPIGGLPRFLGRLEGIRKARLFGRDLQGTRPGRWLHNHRLFHEEAEKKGKGMAQVAEWQAKDFARILHAVPRLVDFPVKQMWIDYDAEADVLYLSFCKPQRATHSQPRDDSIIVHPRGNKDVGVTIQDA